MWGDLLRAFALVMVIEGVMPFVAPERWRQTLARVAMVDGRSLRVFGGVLLAAGAALLHLFSR